MKFDHFFPLTRVMSVKWTLTLNGFLFVNFKLIICHEQRRLMSRMRLRKVESTEILFETRENERWRPLSRWPWVSLSLRCLFQGQRRDRNVKLVYKLKYKVIASTLKPSWIRENGKHSEGSKIRETGRVKSTTTKCEFCEKQRKDLPSWHCACLFQDPSTQQQDPFINKVSWTWMEKCICSCSVW